MTDDLSTRARRLVADAVTRLESSGARTEAWAEFIEERRVLLITRPASMRPLGRVWRLGSLLLEPTGAVHATGRITRAAEETTRGFTSVSARLRDAERNAAARGGFQQGETVNFDTAPVSLDEEALREGVGPLFVRGDDVMVRWSSTLGDDSAIELEAFLADRVGLLVDPPKGAT